VALAADLGRLLLEAKGRVRHGQWIGWVREHCPFTVRTAQNYMKLAEQLGKPNAKRISHLGVRHALAELADTGRRDGERTAIIDGLGVPSVKELVNAMGVEPDSHIRTAAVTGWATDRRFLDKLTNEEREVFRQLPTGEFAKPMSAETIEGLVSAHEDAARPLKRIGRRFNPKDRIGRELKRLRPMVLMEAESGEVIPADADTFAMLRRRHKGADVNYDPQRQIIVFRLEGAVVAALCPGQGLEDLGVKGDAAEVVRGLLADLRAKLDQVEAAELGDPIEAVQVAVRLAKAAAELDALCPAPAKTTKEGTESPAG
jgi:hypothetical protein